MAEIKEPKNMSDEELLEIVGRPPVVLQPAEHASAILRQRAFDSLIKSINKNSSSSDNLSKRIFWLTLIVTIATVVWVAISIYQFIKQ
jgi:hypothetical protein